MAPPSLAIHDVLAAVAGHDPHLADELRTALLGGAAHYADLLKRARCDANWVVAAKRLSGLAASFSATELQAAADEALAGAPGDPVALRRITRAIVNLQG
ncbi:MAG: Hpt domain-containing protein [Chakrabartia sp.]